MQLTEQTFAGFPDSSGPTVPYDLADFCTNLAAMSFFALYVILRIGSVFCQACCNSA